MRLYWPISDLSDDEKRTRTANTVGLQLPTMMGDEEWARLNKGAKGGADVDASEAKKEGLLAALGGTGLGKMEVGDLGDVELPASIEEAFKIVTGGGAKEEIIPKQ